MMPNSGGVIDSEGVERLFQIGAWFLSEMMNFPGVLSHDEAVMQKISIAKKYRKPIDGHAPGLVGDDLTRYIDAGISTDHECSNLDEAMQRINQGMFVQIREGSAARNFNQLYHLLYTHPLRVMLCTDDSHPDDISEKGHIDKIVRMALMKGLSIFDIYQAALINPVQHYHLPVGMLRVGDAADFIVVDDLHNFNILSTFINGTAQYEGGELTFSLAASECINNFTDPYVSIDQIKVSTHLSHPAVKVIELTDGELLTNSFLWHPSVHNGEIHTSQQLDIAKIVVINRYHPAPPSIGFVRGFGISKGAFGATIAHDSHNVIVVGTDDASIFSVIDILFKQMGGIAAYADGVFDVLPLPVGGLMSNERASVVSDSYSRLNTFVSDHCKTKIQAPFMTLSFLSLLVIPSLKIGDKGLFDVDQFAFVDLIS